MEYVWGVLRGLVALVMILLNGLLRQGREVFMDNFSTSPTLFLELFRHRTNACGTVRTNRENMPKDISKKDTKLKQGPRRVFSRKPSASFVYNYKRILIEGFQ